MNWNQLINRTRCRSQDHWPFQFLRITNVKILGSLGSRLGVGCRCLPKVMNTFTILHKAFVAVGPLWNPWISTAVALTSNQCLQTDHSTQIPGFKLARSLLALHASEWPVSASSWLWFSSKGSRIPLMWFPVVFGPGKQRLLPNNSRQYGHRMAPASDISPGIYKDLATRAKFWSLINQSTWTTVR